MNVRINIKDIALKNPEFFILFMIQHSVLFFQASNFLLYLYQYNNFKNVVNKKYLNILLFNKKCFMQYHSRLGSSCWALRQNPEAFGFFQEMDWNEKASIMGYLCGHLTSIRRLWTESQASQY